MDETCPCYTCQKFSRAYVSHLVRSQEILAYTLLSIHNITELIRFTQKIREAILSDRLTTEFGQLAQRKESGDEEWGLGIGE